jgi:hypothetical protein
MKTDSKKESSVTVRVVYQLFFDSDLIKSADALLSAGLEAGISGFIEKGNRSESLIMTLDGFPLDIGRFIVSINSSLPADVNIKDLALLRKKGLSPFKAYSFYSNFSEEETEKDSVSDLELSEEEIQYSEKILEKLLSGKAVNFELQSAGTCNGEINCFVCSECDIGSVKNEVGNSDSVIMYFQDLEHILKYCRFSSELVKSVTNEGIAVNVELKESIFEKLPSLNFDRVKKLSAAVPQSAFLKKIVSDISRRKGVLPILFELKR